MLPSALCARRLKMYSNPSEQHPPRLLNLVPFYYGWFIVALSFLANLTATGIRSAPAMLIHPLEAELVGAGRKSPPPQA